MEFAIIETGGKQYVIKEGEALNVELLSSDLKEGDTVVFDKVLLLKTDKETKVGSPLLEGVTIKAVFEGVGREKKISVVRYRSKSRYFKRRGHRQPFSKVTISGVK